MEEFNNVRQILDACAKRHAEVSQWEQRRACVVFFVFVLNYFFLIWNISLPVHSLAAVWCRWFAIVANFAGCLFAIRNLFHLRKAAASIRWDWLQTRQDIYDLEHGHNVEEIITRWKRDAEIKRRNKNP